MQSESCFHRSSAGMKVLFRSLIALFTICFLTIAAHAQYRASIQGAVTDPQGAVIPGATIILTDQETNRSITTKTNDAGIYSFNSLPPSLFTVSVEANGFKKNVLKDVKVIPEQANSLNVQLELGDTSQTVTVNGNEIPALNTETASVGGTITDNQIQHMPSFGRDVFQLAQLAPGVFGDGAQGGGGGGVSLPGSSRSGTGGSDSIFATENAPQISGNGGQNQNNGITVDGISTVSAVWGGASIITPSEDSVKTVQVVANGYDAQNGRFSATQIQVITKNGTNDVHGSLFFKMDRPGLNAYQRWNGTGAVLRNNNQYNNIGGSIGGPFWKNKLFGFFAYETIRENTKSTDNGWYETPQFLKMAPAGSVAANLLSYPGEGASYSSILPVTCQDAGLTEGPNCRTIPGQGLDVGSPLTSPLGTHDPTWNSGNPGVGNGLDGIADISKFNTVNPTTSTKVQYNGRFDANFTSKDLATFTIYWVPVDSTAYNGPVRAANLYHHSAINNAFTGLWTHTFSPTLLNEARVDAAGWRWNEITSNPQEPWGLPVANIDNIGSANLQAYGAPAPSVFNQWTYNYADVMTKIWGNHQLKFGGQATRLYYLNSQAWNARPNYSFRNMWDLLNDAPYQEAGTFNPLTGIPTSVRQDNRETLWGFFIQDNFKVKPNLTLTAGLRWEYFGPLSSKQNNLSAARLGSGADALTGMYMKIGGNQYNAQKWNFGPQLGFAWSPNANQGKFVLRGGFGINYNQQEIAITANGTNNPPLVANGTLCCSSNSTPNVGIVYQFPSDPHSFYGYPSNPNVISPYGTNGLPETGSPITVTGFPVDLPTGYTYHYSLDTQYDLSHNWIATLGYQGSTTRHIIHQFNQNVLAVASGIPFNPMVQSLGWYGNGGMGNYNAMLVGLKHQFSKSFSLDAQYAWAKGMDTGSHPYYQDPYPYILREAWGRSDYNVTNAFKLYGLWQPTIFRGSHGWIEKIAGGWSLSGILNIHSGFPWTPIYSNTQGDLYFQGSGGDYSKLRPTHYLGGAGSNTGNTAFKTGSNYSQGALSYFTVPAFTTAPAFPGRGTLPELPGVARNSLNGPNYRDVDATLTKAFGLPNTKILGENAKFEIRGDFYNLFNILNLRGGSYSDNSAGIENHISNDGISSNPSFGQSQSALAARVIELQARFSF